ncbi:hypothetical protein H8K90_16440 [Winogradskyella echinorum]|uniref:Uncharacterized protein n=1 Tax=Winogradskyella echinorum TaxID=538189 RepID=A0ABR6Y6X5_9FLAO|nr:hypothetical protein [Winogradskyella echinorum]MBC3847985.1 hypothetical protein [Winogradskyella echinorum]MBC5752333.1 hypothetical protein [Winogradskyella echinorum]
MQRTLFILILLLCYSCRCDEETYYLSDDTIALFPYENASSLTFIDSNQNFILFESITYEHDIYEESSPTSSFYTGSNCDDSFEEINVSMSSSSNYELYVGTSSGFRTTIVDNNVGSFGIYYGLEENNYINNYSYNGVIYDDVLRIYSNFNNSEIILIQNIGVVSIRFGNQEMMLEN